MQFELKLRPEAVTLARALVRRSDPLSSHRAADIVEQSGKAASVSKLLEKAVRKKPGLTSAEYAEEFGIDRHDAARRLPGLRAKGLVFNYHRNSEWANVDKKEAREKFSRPCRVTKIRSMTWWPR